MNTENTKLPDSLSKQMLEHVWFIRNENGEISSAKTIEELKTLVISGEISANTEISKDKQHWSQAVSFPELGFDCVILDVKDTWNILGPFTREYVDRADIMADIPSDGILFVRSGTLKESLSYETASTTGAALVGRVIAAEKALRENERIKTEAVASLAAKDLEFDAERQKLMSRISELMAAEVKLKSQIDKLITERDNAEIAEKRHMETEAKLVDSENAFNSAKKTGQELTSKLKQTEESLKKEAEYIKKLEQDLDSMLKQKNDAVSAEKEAKENNKIMSEKIAAFETDMSELQKQADSARIRLNSLQRIFNSYKTFITLVDEKLSEFTQIVSEQHSELSAEGELVSSTVAGQENSIRTSDDDIIVADIIYGKHSIPLADISSISEEKDHFQPDTAVNPLSAIEAQLRKEISVLSNDSSPAPESKSEKILGWRRKKR